jgi:hypothetical protein
MEVIGALRGRADNWDIALGLILALILETAGAHP